MAISWPDFSTLYATGSAVDKPTIVPAHTTIKDELKRISEIVDRSPDLTLDGATVQETALATLISQAITAKTRVLRIMTTGSSVLALGGKVSIAQTTKGQDFTLDLRFCRIRRTTDTAQFAIEGDQNEFPSSNPYVPSSTVGSGTNTVNVDATPQGGDMSRFFVGGTIILREGSNKHESKITGISGSVVTFADNTSTSFSTSATIHIFDEWALNANVAEGDRVLTVNGSPSTSGLAVGDYVIVQDDKTAGDVQGSSTNPINIEPHIVAAVSTTSVTLDRGLSRALITAKYARVTKITPSYDVSIIGPPQDEISVSPSVVTPLYEAKMAVGARFIRCGIDETENTYGAIGQLVRLENCLDTVISEPYRVGQVATTDATSGRRYGIYAVGCRDTRVLMPRFVRCRHGVVAGSACTGFHILGGTFDDCLVSGVDAHGGDSIGVTVTGANFFAGPSRATDSSNQRAISIGNSTHQAGDRHVLASGCPSDRFTDATGAIEIRTPSKLVSVEACHFKDCDDAVTLKETGTIDGGNISVDSITLDGCTGYAVDDDTTSTKFSRVSIGTVLTDGSAAGVHAVGASGAASYPDLVPSKGLVLGQETSVSTTPYNVSKDDRWLSEVSGSFDRRLLTLRASAGNTTAQTFNLPADAQVNDMIMIRVPDAKTATVTVGLQSGATFQDGATTWTAAGPLGSGVDRELRFTCRANSGGSSAVWYADGDLAPKNGYYSLAYPLIGSVAQDGVTSFSANYTLATTDQGKQLDFTGSLPAQLTLPSSWSGVREVFPLFNSGTATLTIAGGTSGSMTVAAGETATIIWTGSQWRVLPGGTYTAMT